MEIRYAFGETPTDYTYTGQRSEVSSFGLMYYNARWYEPGLGRFVEADSIVPEPGNPLAWERYSYVLNNPLRFTDPSGHECFGVGSKRVCNDDEDIHGDWRQRTKNPYQIPWAILTLLGRVKLSQSDLEWIALGVFSESSNGDYPESILVKQTWTFFNTFAADTNQGDPPGAVVINHTYAPKRDIAGKFDGVNTIDRLSNAIACYKDGTQCPRFSPNYLKVLGIVQQQYKVYENGGPDPTHGSTMFVSVDLAYVKRNTDIVFNDIEQAREATITSFSAYAQYNTAYRFSVSEVYLINHIPKFLITNNDSLTQSLSPLLWDR